jgi:hypothetical protein
MMLRRGTFLAVALILVATAAEASVGLIEIPDKGGAGVVTVYYPSTGEAKTVRRGPFTFEFAWQGGRWSPALFTHHCEAHIADDFQACVGLATSLHGNCLDGTKETIALWVSHRAARQVAGAALSRRCRARDVCLVRAAR